MKFCIRKEKRGHEASHLNLFIKDNTSQRINKVNWVCRNIGPLEHVLQNDYIHITLFTASLFLFMSVRPGCAFINQQRFVQAHYAVLPPSYWHKIRSYQREHLYFTPDITLVVKHLILHSAICMGNLRWERKWRIVLLDLNLICAFQMKLSYGNTEIKRILWILFGSIFYFCDIRCRYK